MNFHPFLRWEGVRNNINKVCTCGPLTYVSVLKNAHSFFYRNFVETFKWWPIEYGQIPWGETLVFGHIQDPVQHRHKGVAEFIRMTGCENLLNRDKNFQKLIRHACCLDEHSVSLYEKFGTRCWSIDWIPLYDDHARTIKLTEKLIHTYGGQKIFSWDHSLVHRMTPETSDLYSLLKSLWEASLPLPGHAKSYLIKDQNLYQEVMEKFNPMGDTWPRCSWLREE